MKGTIISVSGRLCVEYLSNLCFMIGGPVKVKLVRSSAAGALTSGGPSGF